MKNSLNSHIYKFLMFGSIIAIIIVGSMITISKHPNFSKLKSNKITSPLPRPQIAGWIAWWDEQMAYDLIKKYPGEIKSISPVWFMVDKNLTLSDVGKLDKTAIMSTMKSAKITVYPSLGSEISGKELGRLLGDSKKVDALIDSLVEEIVFLDASGVDIDLEAIEAKHKENLTRFLTKLSVKLKEKNLKMTVAVHAKNPAIVWEGSEGQDLEVIGRLADEVRIMLYDEHYAEGEPGSIASYKWITDVVQNTLNYVPIEKIVAGIPSYGYIWGGKNTHGLQFYEFQKEIIKMKATSRRDESSGELVFEGEHFEGWLSDSQSMTSKVTLVRTLGINKFIIWHLGGMDENFFNSPVTN